MGTTYELSKHIHSLIDSFSLNLLRFGMDFVYQKHTQEAKSRYENRDQIEELDVRFQALTD